MFLISLEMKIFSSKNIKELSWNIELLSDWGKMSHLEFVHFGDFYIIDLIISLFHSYYLYFLSILSIFEYKPCSKICHKSRNLCERWTFYWLNSSNSSTMSSMSSMLMLHNCKIKPKQQLQMLKGCTKEGKQKKENF